MRLALALAMGSIGAIGMWSVVVVLPTVQAEFSATRGAVSLASTAIFMGFGSGGVATGRITDRYGIVPAVALSITFLAISFVLAGLAASLWQFIAIYFLIGLGTSATFAPLIAEVSHWFERYRGLAVSIVASGNYVAGALWPPFVNWGVQAIGWRATHIAIGIFCAVSMTLLLLALRARMNGVGARDHTDAPPPQVDLQISTNALTALLCIASIACCVAMAMPQVHIVAYCGDLGYGVARGAEMLSLMTGFGIVSRIGSGFLADRDRRHPYAPGRINRAGRCAAVLPVLRRPDLALPDLGDVRPVPGRHRVELRHHRARGDAGGGSGDPHRYHYFWLGDWHVVRRLGVRGDF